MATAATKFRIDVSIHNLLQNSNGQKPRAAEPKGLTLPVPVFPQYPEKLNAAGPQYPAEGNRVMLPQGRGSIVNVPPADATSGAAGSPVHVASKHAVEGLTHSAALTIAGTRG